MEKPQNNWKNKPMLKQRVFTAIILIPLVFLAIYYANDVVLLSIIGIIVMAMAWEWTTLIPISLDAAKLGFIGSLALLIWPVYAGLTVCLWLNSLLWVGILAAVVTYPASRNDWGRMVIMLGVAWFMLALFANCLWALFHQEHGRVLLIYLLCLVWASDIGAYFTGKLWGRHRLIPEVSPGKTWEGTVGGVVWALGISALGYAYFHPQNAWIWFVQSGILIAIAMLGDLWISMLKRRVQVKDTGQLLPGHGGVLDRLDSLLACLPFFYFFTQTY